MDETKMSRYYISRAATRQEIFYFHAEQWIQSSSCITNMYHILYVGSKKLDELTKSAQENWGNVLFMFKNNLLLARYTFPDILIINYSTNIPKNLISFAILSFPTQELQSTWRNLN